MVTLVIRLGPLPYHAIRKKRCAGHSSTCSTFLRFHTLQAQIGQNLPTSSLVTVLVMWCFPLIKKKGAATEKHPKASIYINRKWQAKDTTWIHMISNIIKFYKHVIKKQHPKLCVTQAVSPRSPRQKLRPQLGQAISISWFRKHFGKATSGNLSGNLPKATHMP